MPKYMPTEDEMDGLYPSSESPPETETETETESPETVDEEAAEETTALVPKSALGGYECKEGETITMKVVKNYGDEVELAPVSASKPKRSMMMESNDEIDSMDKKEMM